MNIAVEIIDFEESREVVPTLGADGRVTDLSPVEGSERAFLHLRLPNGRIVRVEIPHEQLTSEVLPFATAPDQQGLALNLDGGIVASLG